METVTQVIKLVEYANKAYKFFKKFRKMSIFEKFKVDRYFEICVYPHDADIGKEARLLLEISVKVKVSKDVKEDISIANVSIRVPKEKKNSIFWRYVSDKKPCKWRDWREFEAITPYEVNKHSRGMGCGKYLYEENKFFPKKEGEIMVMKPGQIYEIIFAFELRRRSPYERPIEFRFYDEFDELVDSKVVLLNE